MKKVSCLILLLVLSSCVFGQRKNRKNKNNPEPEIIAKVQSTDLTTCFTKDSNNYIVNIKIIRNNGGSISFAQLQIDIPTGYEIKITDSIGAKSKRKSSKLLQLIWADFPEQQLIEIEYSLSPINSNSQSIIELTGEFAYLWLKTNTNKRSFIVNESCQ